MSSNNPADEVLLKMMVARKITTKAGLDFYLTNSIGLYLEEVHKSLKRFKVKHPSQYRKSSYQLSCLYTLLDHLRGNTYQDRITLNQFRLWCLITLKKHV